ncbi:baseplate J/gp47 family protein [Vibrio rhizosphaerae]|uniref:baseplate J/gp47 family protein n=1 Tax=Vibrio rhizosphaerae TaxID=398736 RepID=UPI00056D9F43|nr:baseplate J/gp47 family protein [Vibrio rhizosphaerae]
MSNRPQADFLTILAESGVPLSEQALEEQLKKEVSAAGSLLSNDSEMSPFWRWVRAAVVKPALWMTRTLLVTHVMPNMFVATAERWALELKAWELNVEPKQAVKTQGYLTMTKENINDEVLVERGVFVQTLAIEGVVYRVKVTEDTVIPGGLASGQVPVEAEQAGVAYNLPAGYLNILPTEVPGIVSVVNDAGWITRLGANEESDEELALRLQNAFTGSGEWHINDVYRSIIASVAGIRSDNIFFRNTGDISPGTAEALILVEVGETPQSIIETLNDYIMNQGHHGHGDVLTCKPIPETRHDVIADVVLAKNLTVAQMAETLQEVRDRIRAAFRETKAYDEMTRAAPQSRFSISRMATEIHNNMANVKSVRITLDGEIQEDIVSGYTQPRLKSLTVGELADE